MYDYKESLLAMIVNILATVVASLVPLLSIVVLSILETFANKMSAIVVFSALFSLTLCLMTNARRVEVFAATAA